MVDYPAISGVDDASQTRVALIQGKQIVHVPLLELPIMPFDQGLADIAALAVTDGNIIVGNGTNWVAESGATARTSLGLGTGDTPDFTDLVGTTTNNNAAAGAVGEVITASVVSGSAVTLTTTVAKDVTSISLTAGDWDVHGTVGFFPGATTSISLMQQSISLTTNTHDTAPGSFQSRGSAAFVPGANATNNVLGATTLRISLAGTTTVYLVASSTFTVAGQTAYGQIWARRAR